MVKRTDIDMVYYKMCKNGFMMCLSGILYVGSNVITVPRVVWTASFVMLLLYLLEFSMNFHHLRGLVETQMEENK